MKQPSPKYSAVIGCGPSAENEVSKVAMPFTRLSSGLMGEPPSLNCTCPVGSPAAGGVALTVALSVTF